MLAMHTTTRTVIRAANVPISAQGATAGVVEEAAIVVALLLVAATAEAVTTAVRALALETGDASTLARARAPGRETDIAVVAVEVAIVSATT